MSSPCFCLLFPILSQIIRRLHFELDLPQIVAVGMQNVGESDGKEYVHGLLNQIHFYRKVVFDRRDVWNKASQGKWNMHSVQRSHEYSENELSFFSVARLSFE